MDGLDASGLRHVGADKTNVLIEKGRDRKVKNGVDERNAREDSMIRKMDEW